MIKLVILDVDGVMTDGTKTYGVDGKVISKRFNDKDFTAIKQLKAAGVSVCFLSGDKNVNESIANSRKIDFYHSLNSDGVLNKESWLPILLKKYNVTNENTVYVGDDYFDLSIMNELHYTFCPFDSPKIIKESSYGVLDRNGGCGVIVSLVEYLLKYDLINFFEYDKVLDIDSKEKK